MEPLPHEVHVLPSCVQRDDLQIVGFSWLWTSQPRLVCYAQGRAGQGGVAVGGGGAVMDRDISLQCLGSSIFYK